MSNHPVRFVGVMPMRRGPIAHLDDVRADARLSLERDLRTAPTPLSGGMRKALSKELSAQDALRFRPPRSWRENRMHECQGMLLFTCYRCGHGMLFDEVDMDDPVRCDRCRQFPRP